MLTLEPPSLFVDGIPILRDDRDPLTLYYVNTLPRISRVARETETGEVHVVPYLELLKYRALGAGDDEPFSGGVLFGDVDLGVDDTWLAEAAQAAQTALGLPAEPRLRPPDWETGEVTFMVLGAVSTPTDPDADSTGGAVTAVDVDGSRFVTRMAAATSPTLIGDNRAIFQVELDKAGVAMVEASLQAGTILPIGVVYNLMFLAKRPAFRVQIKADWSQVLHLVDERFSMNAIFVSVDIENLTQELIDQKVIEIITEVDDPKHADAAAKATEELKTLVLERFFEPALSPTKASEPSVPDAIVDFYKGMKQVALGNVGYSRRQVDASQTQQWNVSQSLITAVERRVAPQAYLATLVEGAALTTDQVVREVRLDKDQFFRIVNLEIRALVPWERHNIEAVTATVRYGDEIDTFEFLPPSEPSTPGATFRRFIEPTLGMNFEYEWTVRFADDAAGFHRIDSGPCQVSGDVLHLDDNDLYTWRDLVVRVEDGLWDDFDVVEMEVEVAGSDAARHRHTVVVRSDDDADAPRWTVALPGITQPVLAWTATYRAADRDSIVVAGEPTTIWTVDLRNPLKGAISALFAADDPFGELRAVLLEVSTDDPTAGPAEIERVMFARNETTAPPSVKVLGFDDIHEFQRNVADPQALTYYWRQSLLPVEGPRVRTQWRRATSTEITLGQESARQWQVDVQLAGQSFAALGLESVALRLWVDGPSGPEQVAERIFRSLDERSTWVLELKNPALTTYRQQITYTNRFGRRIIADPAAASGWLLTIPTIRV
jgi:hypothetical protein